MEKSNVLEEFVAIIKNKERELDEQMTLDSIKAWDGVAMDYKIFDVIVRSKFVERFDKFGSCFIKKEYAYQLRIFLVDKTSIEVIVLRKSCPNLFISEDVIVVDTVECMERLEDMLSENRLVCELRIIPPVCTDLIKKKFVPKSLSFSAIEDGGNEDVGYGEITEVSSEVIHNIP